MRTIILVGIAIGLLTGTAILSSESAKAQYTTQPGHGWRAKAMGKELPNAI